MIPFEKIKAFYTAYLPDAVMKGHQLVAPCPFCKAQEIKKQGTLSVHLNPDSYFRGYFRCQQRCVPGGFHFHFAQQMGIESSKVPGFDPEDEGYVVNASYPSKNLQDEIVQFTSLLGQDQLEYFAEFGVSPAVIKEMRVGFNGRYIIYPYFQDSGYAYAAHCIMPEYENDDFWHGNEDFAKGEFKVFNAQEIHRCKGGALFIIDGELNLIILKELGYPAIAVPMVDDLTDLVPERLADINHIFLMVTNAPEARMAARNLAVRLGFKARILTWPSNLDRGHHLAQLATDETVDTKKAVSKMVKGSQAFSPFISVAKERRRLMDFLEKEKGKDLLGIETGFTRFDGALEGLRGINIMGGPPKAGKSCFFMQISTEVARRNIPVIYYDFENGRQKIYLRTLVRLSGIPEKKIRRGNLNAKETQTLEQAWTELERILKYFRVMTDRNLTADTMRRHIDFIKHETGRDELLIVIDSLHKLPFKDLIERRTGIDSWLRQFESIRDEQSACFLVVSELTRGKGGGYGESPDLSSFKESGDIEYSADNAMILMPDWDPLSPVTEQQRKSVLWVAASRENNPGRIAEYALDYPFWRFNEW